MASTYEPIATKTGTGSSALIDFTTIPQTYTDLVLVVQAATPSGATTLATRLSTDNGSTFDSTANYSRTFVYGDGSSAGSSRNSNIDSAYLGSIEASTITTYIVQFMNYSNTTTFKTFLARANNTSWTVAGIVDLWRATNAISGIRLLNLDSRNFSSTTTATLYGIKAA
jgi:hypothetical protein